MSVLSLTWLPPVDVDLLPVRYEDVRFARLVRMSVRCPYELCPIGTEHRESIERLVERELLETGTVGVYKVEIEISASWTLVIGRKNYTLSVRRPRRTEVRTAKMRDLPLVRAVGIHDEQLDFGRSHQPLVQKIPVSAELR